MLNLLFIVSFPFQVIVPSGHPTEFSVIGSGGVENFLRAENDPEDIAGSVIVVT